MAEKILQNEIKQDEPVLTKEQQIMSEQSYIPSGDGIKTSTPPAIQNFNSGTDTKNTADVSTTQTIAHGLGVIPRMVKINGKTAGTTVISVTDTVYTTSQSSNYVFCETGSGTIEGAGSLFRLYSGSSPDYQGGVVTTDITNIYIVWTKVGNPVGTAYLLWEAYI